MILDVKLDGCHHKARLGAVGHQTEPPASVLMYAIVVSREMVRIALTITALNDVDLWFKPVVRPDNGLRYYAYVLLYMDDCLCIHHDAESALYEIDKYFPMNKGSIGNPDIYLGSKLRLVTLCNGVKA